MNNMKTLFFILLAFHLAACHNINKDKQLSFALNRAKENRHELEYVLDHYKHDSLKYQAACFLIRNMPGHCSYIGTMTTQYNRLIDSTLFQSQKEGYYRNTPYLAKLIDSISEIHENTYFPLQEDIRVITADFLIHNIEQAFDLWKNKPWAQHLTFDDFCEYLLPYQIGKMDVLEDWRTNMYKQIDIQTLAELEDFQYSSEMCNSSFWACKHINKFLEKKLIPENSVFSTPFIAKTSTRSMITFGSCYEFNLTALAIMRCVGIPVMIDFTPQWPFRSMGHTWNILLENNGKNLSFGGCDTDSDPDKLHKPSLKMAKVYRRTYAINHDIVRLIETEQIVPNLFQNIFMKDVTHEYMKTCDITIPTKWKRKQTYVYLAVFDNQQWTPVCYGIQERNKCQFKGIGKGIVYLPIYYNEQGIHPISDPFLLDLQGNIKYLNADINIRKEATLNRKYYLSQSMFAYAKCLSGGQFEASNASDFNIADSIYTLPHWSLTTDSFLLESAKTYRYWRYVSPKNQSCNLAELAFYSEDGRKEQTGKVIGTDISVRNNIVHMDKHKVFDKDILTFFEAPTTIDYPWVGLDFGKPVAIDKIIYTPRNDDNNISIGDLYELFYWEKDHWMSLGQQVADQHKLTYTNIPKDALLLLKDLTKGIEERIFTYENGKQIWW